MRTIVHLSDLHFGRVDPAIPPALRFAVAEAAPDLVVVSGDLTQRARAREFRQAADFLASLSRPLLVVPGNHDIPLYDILRRWLAPLRRYKHYITEDLAPFHADQEIAVLGINTARALTFKNGRVNSEQLAEVVRRLASCAPGVTRVIVTHHPFDAPVLPGAQSMHGVVGRAEMAIVGFLRSGVDVILSGHLHVSGVGKTTERYHLPGRTILLIQAGTASSTRQRGEHNAFNVVRIAHPDLSVVRMDWEPRQAQFVIATTERFVDTNAGWVPAAP